MYRIADLRGHQNRWPRFVHLARELGVGSAMGFLLFIDGRHTLGALNFYSSKPGAFGHASEHVGWVLASHAAVALRSAHHVENMDAALASSRSIGEAIGVVMARYKLTEDEAFETIRRQSQHRNIKVRDLATTIISTGELPTSR